MAPSTDIILIAGLGNELLSDDGVGVHACRWLQEQARAMGRDDVVIAEVGTAIYDAMHLLEQAAYVLGIDAVQAGGEAGEIYLVELDDLDRKPLVGLHELSLAGALDMVHDERSSHSSKPWCRPRVELIGVEVAKLTLGTALSPAVERALPRVAEQVWQRVDAWTGR